VRKAKAKSEVGSREEEGANPGPLAPGVGSLAHHAVCPLAHARMGSLALPQGPLAPGSRGGHYREGGPRRAAVAAPRIHVPYFTVLLKKNCPVCPGPPALR